MANIHANFSFPVVLREPTILSMGNNQKTPTIVKSINAENPEFPIFIMPIFLLLLLNYVPNCHSL